MSEIILPLSDQQLRESNPPDIWDNTMRNLLVNCPRKLYFFLRGYDYKIKPPYFAFGSAWHEIQHRWYAFPKQEREEDPESRIAFKQIALDAGLAIWDKEAPEGKGDNTRENLYSLFQLYTDIYTVEPFELIEGGAETGWIWPLPPTTLPMQQQYSLGGSMDGRIIFPPYGAMVLEHKTSGDWLSDGYIAGFRFSPQVTGYAWYDKMLQGEESHGVMVNMACKKTAKAGKTPKFARTLITKSDRQFEDYLTEFYLDLYRFELFWDAWIWPHATDSTNCSGGIGKAPCLFRSVCEVDAPLGAIDPLQFPNIGVREKIWAPWDREGEQG